MKKIQKCAFTPNSLRAVTYIEVSGSPYFTQRAAVNRSSDLPAMFTTSQILIAGSSRTIATYT